MSIITISRGSFVRGKEVAEKLAQSLGYECISRDILLTASDQFNIPEVKLVRAIHDAPSILDRFSHGKERYVAYVRAALLQHVKKDNVVYHGLAGHFFLKGIPHVLKVRIIADFEDRVKDEMKRQNISEKKARYILKQDDDERRKWSYYLYGIDTADSSLYDTILKIKTMTVDDAVDTITDLVKLPCFQITPESQSILENIALIAHIQAVLVEKFPTTKVSVKDGEAFINIPDSLSRKEEIINEVSNIVKEVDGVKNVQVNVVPFNFDD